MATLRSAWVIVCTALVGGACTNDYGEYEFQGEAGAATGGSAGSVGGSGGSQAGASGGGGAAGGASGTSGAAGASGGTGGTSGASGSAGASGTAGAAGTTGIGIGCGTATCTIKAQWCCVQDATSTCIPSGDNCSQGTAIRCDGPEDCEAKVCCAELDGGGSSYTTFTCRNANDCTPQQSRAIVCGATPTACPSPTTCKPSTILPQYNVCG